MKIGEIGNVIEEMAATSVSEKQNENVMKGHDFERTMEGDCWRQDIRINRRN
jgi:hypothetical protein